MNPIMTKFDQTTSNMRFTHYTRNNNASNFVFCILLFALPLSTITYTKWHRAMPMKLMVLLFIVALGDNDDDNGALA